MDHHHLHRWKMATKHKWGLTERRPGFLEEVLKRLDAEGPLTSGDFAERVGKKGAWWDWDDAKIALEYLFWQGRVSATRRPGDFARLYDLTERVIPAHVLARPTPPEHEARKQLLELAARHHGVGTLKDLTDYHRQRTEPCKPLVRELVEEGVLREVRVEGWKDKAYLHHAARVPRQIDACALLSPFDPVVWNRDRAHRLFGFHYRIEIYTPQPKRIYGYYVLPVLWGESVVGRLDMKSDRQGGALLVHAAFTEPGVPHGPLADDLAPELHAMAGWLGLDRVEVGSRGDLASTLREAVDHYARR
jgi:uncharacterized protein YcaQ